MTKLYLKAKSDGVTFLDNQAVPVADQDGVTFTTETASDNR